MSLGLFVCHHQLCPSMRMGQICRCVLHSSICNMQVRDMHARQTGIACSNPAVLLHGLHAGSVTARAPSLALLCTTAFRSMYEGICKNLNSQIGAIDQAGSNCRLHQASPLSLKVDRLSTVGR